MATSETLRLKNFVSNLDRILYAEKKPAIDSVAITFTDGTTLSLQREDAIAFWRHYQHEAIRPWGGDDEEPAVAVAVATIPRLR